MLALYVHSVTMTNFKSIGKNESSKSNILEGLSYINFIGDMNKAFSKSNVNRSNGSDAKIEYIINLKATNEDYDLNKIKQDTVISISDNTYSATGGILDYFNKNIRPEVNELIEFLSEYPFKFMGPELTTYQNNISILYKEDFLDIKKVNNTVTYLTQINSKIINEENESLTKMILGIEQKWQVLLLMLPTIFFRNSNKVLSNQYSYDDVKKELNKPSLYPNSLLSDFVKLIDIPSEDFISAIQGGHSGPNVSMRSKINKNINKIVNKNFQSFYTTESISLSIEFNSNAISFSVQSSDSETLLLSERSNGLKWYLNMFIDATVNGISKSNSIYLFDEPGISLHVNAQRELLNLFKDLTNKGNQVVYTTHSPYMLHTAGDGIHHIRAVEKDERGYTHIYKTAYDARLSPENQQDTLAPIISSLGMNLSDTF